MNTTPQRHHSPEREPSRYEPASTPAPSAPPASGPSGLDEMPAAASQRPPQPAAGLEPWRPDDDDDRHPNEAGNAGDLAALQDEERGPGPRPLGSFGRRRMRLHADPIPGFKQRWINEHSRHLQDAKDSGFSHVMVNGKPRKEPVGKTTEGTRLDAYLMKIPEEWFEEMTAEFQAEVDEIDAAIRGGNVMRKEDDGRYVPASGIRYE